MEGFLASLGRKVTLTIRKEGPQARLLHTLHVFISFTLQEAGQQDNQAKGVTMYMLCVLRDPL